MVSVSDSDIAAESFFPISMFGCNKRRLSVQDLGLAFSAILQQAHAGRLSLAEFRLRNRPPHIWPTLEILLEQGTGSDHTAKVILSRDVDGNLYMDKEVTDHG